MNNISQKIRGIQDLGASDPSEAMKEVIPVITTRQLQLIFNNIGALKQQDIHKIALLGNGSQAFPPNSLVFAEGLLDKTQNVGLLYWKEGRGLVVRLECLEAVTHRVSTDSNFSQLIFILKNAGWQSRNIAFSITPCEPFLRTEPPDTSKSTAIMSVLSVADATAAHGLLSKALQLSQAGSWNKAIESFEGALEFNPADADAWSGKAAALLMTASYDEALHSCNCALFVKPNYAGAWYNKGLVLFNGIKKYDEAMKCFQEAERLGMSQAANAIKMCRQALG